MLGEIGQEDKWKLSVWGCRVSKHPTLPIYYKGKFNARTIGCVYDDMDVLIVPSVWKETFSLVTLEALSHGVLVIVSDNVGAQDIVKQYNEKFVYHERMDLENLLKSIIEDKLLLLEYNRHICKLHWNHDMLSHAEEIMRRLYIL